MPQYRRTANPFANWPESAGSGARVRQRADIVSDSPAARVQRMLVLAERFRSLAVLRSDPARLVDLLRSIISLARETFGPGALRERAPHAPAQAEPDLVRCVRDLERLLQGLAHDSPDAWRGMGHAMDALLIQCLLFEPSADKAVELTDP